MPDICGRMQFARRPHWWHNVKGRRRGTIEPIAVQADRAVLRRVGFGVIVLVEADVERNEDLRHDEQHRQQVTVCSPHAPPFWPLEGIWLHLEVCLCQAALAA